MQTEQYQSKADHYQSDNQLAINFGSTKDTLQIYSQFVTAELATKLLATNHDHNRKLNKKVVSSYARQMLKGLWHSASGETIKLSHDKIKNKSILIDGQHRIAAVIEACELSDTEAQRMKLNHEVRNIDDLRFTGIEMLFASGIPDSARLSIDDGHRRSLSDCFKLNNRAMPNQASINGSIIMLQNLKGCVEFNKHYESVSGARRMSSSETLAFYDSLPNYDKKVTSFFATFRHAKLKNIMPLGTAISMYYLFEDLDPKLLLHIFKTYETGIPFDESYGKGERNPAYKVYQRVRRDKEMKIRIKPYQHVMLFMWAYKECLEHGTNRPPRLLPWVWDSLNPIIKHGSVKLARVGA